MSSKPQYPEIPMHDIQSSRREELDAISEFIEWLRSNDMFISEYAFMDERNFHQGVTDMNRLLARYLGVDYEAYNAEKNAMLKYYRELQESTERSDA